jgi:hypothetical protein
MLTNLFYYVVIYCMFTFLFGITVTINIITKIKWRPKLNYRDMQAQNIMHAIQSEAGYNF